MKTVWILFLAVCSIGVTRLVDRSWNVVKVATPYSPVNVTCKGIGIRIEWWININQWWSQANILSEGMTAVDNAINSFDKYNLSQTLMLKFKAAIPKPDRPFHIRCLVVECNTSISCFDEVGIGIHLEGFKSVQNVSVNMTDTNSTVELIWSPPSIPWEHLAHLDLIYKIGIDIIRQHQLFYRAMNTTHNVTHFRLPELQLCDIVLANVSDTLNAADGKDYRSKNVSKNFLYDLNSYKMVMKFVFEVYNFQLYPNENFSIFYRITVSSFPHKMCNYTVEFITDTEYIHINKHHDVIHPTNPPSVTHLYEIYGLPLRVRGNVTVNILNFLNETIATANATFGTYDVQELGVTSRKGIIRLICFYALFSQLANGCRVTFTHLTQGFTAHVDIPKSKGQRYIKLTTSGDYAIAAYDIVHENVSDVPAVEYPGTFSYDAGIYYWPWNNSKKEKSRIIVLN